MGSDAQQTTTAEVTNKWESEKGILRYRLADGTDLRSSEDHRVMVGDDDQVDWKEGSSIASRRAPMSRWFQTDPCGVEATCDSGHKSRTSSPGHLESLIRPVVFDKLAHRRGHVLNVDRDRPRTLYKVGDSVGVTAPSPRRFVVVVVRQRVHPAVMMLVDRLPAPPVPVASG